MLNRDSKIKLWRNKRAGGYPRNRDRTRRGKLIRASYFPVISLPLITFHYNASSVSLFLRRPSSGVSSSVSFTCQFHYQGKGCTLQSTILVVTVWSIQQEFETFLFHTSGQARFFKFRSHFLSMLPTMLSSFLGGWYYHPIRYIRSPLEIC